MEEIKNINFRPKPQDQIVIDLLLEKGYTKKSDIMREALWLLAKQNLKKEDIDKSLIHFIEKEINSY